MFCRNCGNQLDNDALFCMRCGIKLSEKGIFKYCVHCGNALENDAVFCMSCGKKVQEEETKSEEKTETENVAEIKNAENIDAVVENVEVAKAETESATTIKEESFASPENTMAPTETIVSKTDTQNEPVENDKYEHVQNSPVTQDEFSIVARDLKKFAVIRGGDSNNYYCPSCHAQVNPASDSCTKCGASFYDWGESKGLNDNAGETSEKLAENKRSNEMSDIHILDAMRESSFSEKETTEGKNESTTNMIKSEGQNKKSYGLLVGVIFCIIAIVAGIVFSNSASNSVRSSDTFNFDSLKPYTFKSADRSYEFDCYTVSETALSNLWKNPPRYFIYNSKRYEVDNKNIDYDVDEDEYNVIICWGEYDGTYYHFLGVEIINGSKSMWLWKL